MSYMSFVFQDVTLFNDTVMNNIRLGNPNATDEQVIAAAKAAYCDEFVREMPDAYQTILGENGSTLSGGERQRIKLAKHLKNKGNIFILDEPTRGIDVGAKDQIYTIIENLAKQGMAVIVISSEIPELQLMCDRVCIMSEGKVISEMTREEFIDSDNVLKNAIGI